VGESLRWCVSILPFPSSRPSHSPPAERNPGAPSGRYDGDAASIAGSWDGRGEEPARQGRRLNKKKQHHGLAPWDNVVEDDEVEGGPGDDDYRPPSPRRTPAADPLTSEEFYTTNSAQAPPQPKKKKFGSGLIKNRSRYEQPFDANDATSSRTRASGDYQDEFEREINQGGRSANGGGGSSRPAAGGNGRFDSFEQEGPEDAWASAKPARSAAPSGNGYAGNGSAQRLQPQKTGRAEENDGDRTFLLLFLPSPPFVPPLPLASTNPTSPSQCSNTRSDPT
jgi:hypothetical protein